MIDCKLFFEGLQERNVSFFTGVPDSLLKDFCAYVADHTSMTEHIISANEGGAIALGCGYHLATGKIPLIYMQNSGIGNAVNPLLSLADKEVYSIPMILMIGWRGEPGVKDEPQHIKQGRVQNKMLESMEIPYKILDSSVKDIPLFLDEVIEMVKQYHSPVAMVVRKDTFNNYELKDDLNSEFGINREQALEAILEVIPLESLIVSTTGKMSREVFEYRERHHQGHQNDFLTVGSMGHCSQIALGIALFTPVKVICLDGDGAVIMHLGSLAVSGQNGSSNYIHIVINNGAHDSVGGQPTVGLNVNITQVAEALGYKHVISVNNSIDLRTAVDSLLNKRGPSFLEVKVNKGARNNLGRPTSTPVENKTVLMKYIMGL